MLEGLDGSPPLAQRDGHVLEGEVGDDPQQQDVPLVRGEPLSSSRRRRSPSTSSASSSTLPTTVASWISAWAIGGRRPPARRSSTMRWWAMVNTQDRNPAASPVKRWRFRWTWAITSLASDSTSEHAVPAQVARHRRRQRVVDALEGRHGSLVGGLDVGPELGCELPVPPRAHRGRRRVMRGRAR